MTVRRLNIKIQGFPESYATEPYMSENNMVVGETHPIQGAPSMPPVESVGVARLGVLSGNDDPLNANVPPAPENQHQEEQRQEPELLPQSLDVPDVSAPPLDVSDADASPPSQRESLIALTTPTEGGDDPVMGVEEDNPVIEDTTMEDATKTPEASEEQETQASTS